MDAVRRMGKDVYLNTSEITDAKSVKKYMKFFYNFSDYFRKNA